MSIKDQLITVLVRHHSNFQQLVPFNMSKDKLMVLDFTEKNEELTDEVLKNTNLFSSYISTKLKLAHCKFGVGGYDEHRTIYNRSKHFDSSIAGDEPRRLHLGIDIWGAVNTAVIAPLNGIVHSFAFNNHFGDYGATIILTHNLEGITFHSLYGHLSLNSLKNLQEGNFIKAGDVFAEFGMQFENGHWPPHLHFQLIINIGSYAGDYPGVCKCSEREMFLANCPDPALLLPMLKHNLSTK